MQKRQQVAFATMHSEGTLFTADILQRIAKREPKLDGMTLEDYHLLKSAQFNEVITHAWEEALKAWGEYTRDSQAHPERHLALTREWVRKLLSQLNYGHVQIADAIQTPQRTYTISHRWYHLPIHIVSSKSEREGENTLEKVVKSSADTRRSSPYGMVQELLNNVDGYLWGIVSNGKLLRLLRKNVSMTRQAYIEFNLEAMMNGEVYADFMLFWLLCHQSRLEGEKSEDCRLEKWLRLSHENGIRALDKLRDGVKSAIETLGTGFLRHPMNRVLQDKMRDGLLDTQDYYRQVLRLVYRFIIIFVAEDRQVIFHPQASEPAKERYKEYYSTARLRKLAEKRIGTLHSDLYLSLSLVMRLLGSDDGYLQLGLFALNGFLFSDAAMSDLAKCQLANQDLLEAIRALAFINENNIRFPVDYLHLGSEELGSVYESLLEFVPVITIGKDATVGEGTFVLQNVSGNERKTTGSYYTPTSLIDCLLDSALEPVLAEACKKADPEQAILDLKVCDPACGSGHFLVAAAYRIAKRLASIRSDEIEPPAEVWSEALRDVIGHCIYGVDINTMSVELCKVSLWMEAIAPGKPLSFLDSHIQCGNSLLGTTPVLLNAGIPDSAFEPTEGDDKKICSEYKKKNKAQRIGVRTLFDEELRLWDDRLSNLTINRRLLEKMSDNTVAEIHRKQEYYIQQLNFQDYLNGKLWADSWCAAFLWKKNGEDFPYPITEERFRRTQEDPHNLQPWMRNEIRRLAEQYQFFHWHLVFPDVFRIPSKDEELENKQVGWSGGFDVMLGNPPYIFGEHHAQKMKMCFQTIFDLAKGQYDLYWLFIEQGLKLINSKGRLALVVPDTLLARDETQKTRKLLLQSGLEYIYSCGVVFKANVSTIIFATSNESVTKEVIGKALNEDIVSLVNICSKKRFHLDPKHRFLIHISDDESHIFSRIENESHPLRDFVGISRGEEIGKKGVLSQGPIPIIVGEDIAPYFIEQPSRFLQTIGKNIELYRSPKIVMMKTGQRCIAGLDNFDCVTMQSVYNLHITSSEMDYEPLLAILNSRFVHCFVYKTFTSYKGLFPQLNQSTILDIPIPYGINIVKFELTNLVEEVQKLNKELKLSITSRDKEIIRKEISCVDIKINKLIYNVYGLSEKEIDTIQLNVQL